MRNLRPKRIAIEALLCAALLLSGSAAWAQVVGTVAHLSGPLVAKKPNGSVKVLAVKSEVENGDTLVSEKNTYAQIKFVDNGEITLRPNTTFKIEKFAYDAAKPEGDSASFDLVKGGLRSVTGLLGKRNKEKFALKTPSATIGIRGTTFIANYVPPPQRDDMRINPNPSGMELQQASLGKQPAAGTLDNTLTRGELVSTMVGSNGGTAPASGDGKSPQASDMASQLASLLNGGGTGMNPTAGTGNASTGKVPAPLGGQSGGPTGQGGLPVPQAGNGPLAPGLHLQVTDGAIVVTNNGGSQGFQAGQFGFVPGVNQAPVIVPPNPGIQFTPPPSFNSGTGGPTASNGQGQSQATDCIVR